VDHPGTAIDQKIAAAEGLATRVNVEGPVLSPLAGPAVGFGLRVEPGPSRTAR